MKDYYVSFMFRDEDNDLIQKFVDFKAKNKTQAKIKAKEIALGYSYKARVLGFWER